MKDGAKVEDDLLAAAGLPHFTLHELRDALATHLASHTHLPSSTASAILDHALKEDSGSNGKEAIVTRDHYNKSQRLSLKFAGLQAWGAAVIGEYEEIDRRHRAKYSPLHHDRSKPMKGLAKRVAERATAKFDVRFSSADQDGSATNRTIQLDLKKLSVSEVESPFEFHEGHPVVDGEA